MAKFSQAFLQSMAQPSYQQGLFTAAKELGGLRGRLEKERLEEAEKQQRTQAVASGLDALGNSNVANLKKAAQKFASLNMPEQAAAYMKQAVAVEDRLRQQEAAGKLLRGKQALLRYGTAKGMDLKTESGKQGFFQIAGPYDIPVEDSVNLYNELTDMTGDPNALTAKDINVSYQSVLDGEGREVKQAVFTLGDQILKKETVGFTKGKADDVTDYGLTAKSAPADYDTAILQATNEGANEDARNIQERRDKLFPDVISLSDSLSLARSVTPQFDELLMYESNAANLDAVANRSDLAGASAIMERIISSNFPNDLKAATELERFRASKSLIRKGLDFVSRTATGELTDATIQDYKDIAEIMRIIGKGNIQDTIDSLYMANESDAADRLFDVYIATDPNAATIISIKSP
jgi:hypothetical protein